MGLRSRCKEQKGLRTLNDLGHFGFAWVFKRVVEGAVLDVSSEERTALSSHLVRSRGGLDGCDGRDWAAEQLVVGDGLNYRGRDVLEKMILYRSAESAGWKRTFLRIEANSFRVFAAERSAIRWPLMAGGREEMKRVSSMQARARMLAQESLWYGKMKNTFWSGAHGASRGWRAWQVQSRMNFLLPNDGECLTVAILIAGMELQGEDVAKDVA